jgi:iron complex outermembrane receptor protein
VTLRTGSRHRSLSRAVAVALALSAGSGLAQDVGEVEVSPKKGGYSLALEEVVVTAQKREQDTMSVPISVSSFTAQDMVNTGALNVQDIDDFMPGVEITDTSGGATQIGITIRGITSPNISSGGDPSVATFYDNAYMPRAASSVPFTDIARTEVLKGPSRSMNLRASLKAVSATTACFERRECSTYPSRIISPPGPTCFTTNGTGSSTTLR